MQKRQTILLVILAVVILATIGLWWWSLQPGVSPDTASVAPRKKERKLPESLLADPRFQELQSRGGNLDIGTRGNSNPFEPFK